MTMATAICPLCGGESHAGFVKTGIAIRTCRECGHYFAVSPRPAEHVKSVYSDRYFTGGGAGYRDYVRDADLLRRRGNWYAQQIAPWISGGQMIDIGAAAGFLLQGFCDFGWQGQGIEPNASMADFARQTLGVSIQTSTWEEAPLRPAAYDLVVAIQVVSHFMDPLRAVLKMADSLRPHGYCLVETWDRASWTARVCGRRWHEYSPPSVLHWFSQESLHDWMGRWGFQHVAGGRPRKWISGQHAKSLLEHQFAAGGPARWLRACWAWVPDRWVLPYPAEDLFWALYQKR